MRQVLHQSIAAASCLLVCLVSGFTGIARAASPPAAGNTSKSALAVSPAITEEVIKSGAKATITLQLSNLTDFPLPISGTVKNFVPLQTIEDSRMASKYDASKWFTIADSDFILQPKQSRPVTVTITPPAGSEPGGHYATIYFTPLIPVTALTPSTAYLTAQVGTLAFLIVPGAIKEHLRVKSVSVPKLSQSRSIDLSVNMQNSGNVHLSPNASFVIRDWSGKQVSKVPVQSGIILPGTDKSVPVQWQAPSFIGRYTAVLTASYGANGTVLPPIKVSFWVLPWQTLLVVLIVGGTAGTIALRTRGRWKHAIAVLKGTHHEG